MRIAFIVMCFLFSAVVSGVSQPEGFLDTLIYPDEVTFYSDLEREAFTEYFVSGNENYFKLFLAKDKNITLEDYNIRKEQFLAYSEKLKNDKNIDKPEKSKVKYFFKKIHDNYLVKYELISFFPEIFRNGYYNCVTGSMLYALLFNELNIPYAIKVSPIHAYLVAYPQTSSIIVETTNPVKGYFAFNQTFKENYIKHLRDNKLISPQEYNSGTINQLFDQYYFKEKTISLKNMVGIQYYNYAVEQIQNQKFDEAFFNLEKAYLLYSSQEIGYLLYYTAAFAIQKHDFSELSQVDFLYKIARFKDFGITRDQIVGEFGRITQNQLNYKGNYALYDSIFNRLNTKLTDTITRNEIAFIYHYEKARLFVRNNKLDEALPHVGSAFNLRPDHLDVQTLLLYCVSSKFESQRITENTTEEFILYANNYPAIKENNMYSSLLCDAYIQMAIENYESNNLSKAQNFQKLFHETFITKESYKSYDNGVPRLYSSASVYYFRKGNLSKAKALIIEGLKLVPDSYELNQRLKTFK